MPVVLLHSACIVQPVFRNVTMCVITKNFFAAFRCVWYVPRRCRHGCLQGNLQSVRSVITDFCLPPLKPRHRWQVENSIIHHNDGTGKEW
jgi:hypothetical protein